MGIVMDTMTILMEKLPLRQMNPYRLRTLKLKTGTTSASNFFPRRQPVSSKEHLLLLIKTLT
jgi:hypothetical protein